jgi:hypothetical protein
MATVTNLAPEHAVQERLAVSESPMRASTASPAAFPAPLPATGEVRVLRSPGEIEALRGFWTRHQTHPNCDIDFYLKVVASNSSVLRPHVLVLYRDAEPQALLAGRLDQSSVDLRVGYKTMFALPAPTLTFLHGGFMGQQTPENCAALVQSILGSLHKGEAPAAYFNHIQTDGSLYAALEKLSDSDCLPSFLARRNHRGMTLAKSAEDFLRLLSSKERNNQKRRTKRLLEEFGEGVRLECYRSPDDLEILVRDVNAVAQKTYQRTLGVGFEDTAKNREQLQTGLAHGWMRAWVLYLNNLPCAFWMGNVYARSFYSGFTGYDPAYSKYSPGMYLLLKGLEQLCDENGDGHIRTADFGLGDAEWKVIIGNLEWQEAPVYLFSPHGRGYFLNLIQKATESMDVAGKKLLTNTKVLARVKRLWRDRLNQEGKPGSGGPKSPPTP